MPNQTNQRNNSYLYACYFEASEILLSKVDMGHVRKKHKIDVYSFS
jgi:hypothetical protein